MNPGVDLETIAGGVVAGSEVERGVKSARRHEIPVCLDDGSTRIIRAPPPPPTWRAGNGVKVVAGAN